MEPITLALALTGLCATQDTSASAQRQVAGQVDPLELRFEANLGQTDTTVEYLARGPSYTVYLTATEFVLTVGGERRDGTLADDSTPSVHSASVLRVKLVEPGPDMRIEGLEEMPGKIHYLVGNDPERWRTDVPIFRGVRYRGVQPGVDLVLSGRKGEIEYDFVLAPGAHPESVLLDIEGAAGLEVDESGGLVLRTASGTLRQSRPRFHQQVDGSPRQSPGSYVLAGARRVGFRAGGAAVAGADLHRPLGVPPVLAYSTYLGGSGNERAVGIDVDGEGNAYVLGSTRSLDFPTTGALQAGNGGGNDIFVTKLDPTGTTLVYSTYIGGSADDGFLRGDIVVDDGGHVVAAGATGSANFPTTAGAFQTVKGGDFDAFVLKLDPAGSTLVYSTFLGGGSLDEALGLALDGAGNAYVSGLTLSTNYPLMNPFQALKAGPDDVFVTKLDPAGSSLVYSTYVGGGSFDWGRDIALDADGNVHVTGLTGSADFPVTPGAVQTTYMGNSDAFVFKLDATGSALLYATFLGGTEGLDSSFFTCGGDESGNGIVVDTAGNACVVGYTNSCNFPVANAFQPVKGTGGYSDCFLAKLDPTGSILLFSTYFGGGESVSSGGITCFTRDVASGVALDAAGNIFLTGFTSSCDFPVVDTLFPKMGPTTDAFLARFDPTATTLLFSTFLGGTDEEGENFLHDAFTGGAIALDDSGGAYVVGYTRSSDFPTATPFQGDLGGESDSFVAKISLAAVEFTLDFETEDDFTTPLGNGQVIDTEFGRLVRISGTGANAGPTTFDTTPGGPNDPALNDDMLIGHGNVLLLENDWYSFAQTVPGFFDVVTDDPHGGDLIFDFLQPVDPRSVLLADINPPPNQGASVTLYDEQGRTRTYAVEPGWTGTYGDAGPHELDLTTLAPQAGNGTPRFATAVETQGFVQTRVVRLVVHLTGFGAVDDLTFCIPGATLASATMRNGTGRNPFILACDSMPVLGGDWSTTLDCSGTGCGMAVLELRARAASGTITPFGEVLVDGALLHRMSRSYSNSPSHFGWRVPFDMSLIGLEVHVQGLCRGQAAAGRKTRAARIVLSNALDLVLGF